MPTPVIMNQRLLNLMVISKRPCHIELQDICCVLTKTPCHQLQERAKLCPRPPFNLRLPRVHRTSLGPKSSSRKEELKSINKQRCSSFRFHDIGDLGPWVLHCIRIWKHLEGRMIVISETCHSVWYLLMLCPHDVLKHRFLKRLALALLAPRCHLLANCTAFGVYPG